MGKSNAIATVGASKVLALGLGAICVYFNKPHLIRWAAYWYAGLVVWNPMVMLTAPSATWIATATVCYRIATATVCQPRVFRFHRNNSSNARIAMSAGQDGWFAKSPISLLPRAITTRR